MPLKNRSEAGPEEECIEREAFLLVLREFEAVKGSPWRVLRETVLPKYEALKALGKRAVSPYRARQGQDYLAYRSEQGQCEEAQAGSLPYIE